MVGKFVTLIRGAAVHVRRGLFRRWMLDLAQGIGHTPGQELVCLRLPELGTESRTRAIVPDQAQHDCCRAADVLLDFRPLHNLDQVSLDPLLFFS